MKSLLNAALKIFQNYLVHLAVIAVGWVALHFGWHVSLPVIPASLGSVSLLILLRQFARNIGHAWHDGRLAAQFESAAKQDIEGLVKVVAQDAVNKTSPKAA